MRLNFFLIIGAVAISGCASPNTAAREPAPSASAEESGGMHGGRMAHGMNGMCPMQVEGTTVNSENVEGGAALTFTTSGDIPELRRRVALMASMHTQQHGQSHGDGMKMSKQEASGGAGEHPHDKQGAGGHHHKGGMMAGGMMTGGMMMPPSAARSEEIEGGVRVILTPRDSTQVAALQEHARHMAEQMSSGQCPMMEHNDHGDAPSAASSPDKAEHEAHHPAQKPVEAP